MTTRVAILQPYRENTPGALLDRSAQLIDELIKASRGYVFDLHRAVGTPRAGIGSAKYAPHADVRNQLVEQLDADVDLVLWIDVDLVDYPSDFLVRAQKLDEHAIVAPRVLLEGTDTFFDIGGFVERGRCLSPHPPYAQQRGDVWELDSVGCMYVAPAWIYREPHALRYAPIGPRYGVEHAAVCVEAKRLGVRVLCDTSMTAQHAYMPRYGRPQP